jgi:predicted DNA-binding protein (UPF0251 family)
MTRELLCGITYQQVIDCAGMSQKDAAKRLGVNHAYFNRVLHRHGMAHYFPKPKQTFTNCVTAEDIAMTAAEGYTQKDAAYVLGISYRHMLRLTSQWGLSSLFPNSGKASWVARKGYVDNIFFA